MTYLNILLFSVLDVESKDSIDYKIASYLLTNTDKLIGSSLSEIAQDCNVSNASISRFCKKIGLLDYIDLQMLIRGNHTAEENTVIANKTTEDYKKDFFDNLKSMKVIMDKDENSAITEELLCDILQFEHIACFGHLQSGNIAKELRHNLSRIKKFAYYSQSMSDQKSYLASASNKDLIIIFSATGRFFQRLHTTMGDVLRKKKPKVYMIIASKSTINSPYIDKVIMLNESYDANMSHISMYIYANYLSYLFQNVKQ